MVDGEFVHELKLLKSKRLLELVAAELPDPPAAPPKPLSELFWRAFMVDSDGPSHEVKGSANDMNMGLLAIVLYGVRAGIPGPVTLGEKSMVTSVGSSSMLNAAGSKVVSEFQSRSLVGPALEVEGVDWTADGEEVEGPAWAG